MMLSNISPQDPDFNRGIWRDLEARVRDWADLHGEVFVVTGPVRSLLLKYVPYTPLPLASPSDTSCITTIVIFTWSNLSAQKAVFIITPRVLLFPKAVSVTGHGPCTLP